MAPAEGAPDEPGIDNPEQQPSGTNSELAELKRMFMDSQMESREREKRIQAPLGLKQFVVQQSFQLCSALLEHRPKLYFSTSVSFCLSTVYNMAPAEGAPDEPGIDNPEQQPSGTNSELAELKRMFMDSQMESREREKRMCAALQSRNTLTEAGKLARVPPGTCYSSALVVQNCQLQKSDQ
ncbi:hypothetical protein COCOBI_06-4430 [Coccomyxa sp. Obi]|nr:hypothetical protein COCOBI_06-4430 [Coccomyxa sp. Obi]